MTESIDPIRIELTEEQKNQIKEVTGKEASAIELTVEDLDARTRPRKSSPTRPRWGRIGPGPSDVRSWRRRAWHILSPGALRASGRKFPEPC